ncbi:hypothetical protein JOM56_004905 [Amanita muscaria]
MTSFLASIMQLPLSDDCSLLKKLMGISLARGGGDSHSVKQSPILFSFFLTFFGQYDQEYLTYNRSLLSLLPQYGMVAFVSLHQDVWSRYSGGSGALAWTLESVGFDLRGNRSGLVRWCARQWACQRVRTRVIANRIFQTGCIDDGVEIIKCCWARTVNCCFGEVQILLSSPRGFN